MFLKNGVNRKKRCLLLALAMGLCSWGSYAPPVLASAVVESQQRCLNVTSVTVEGNQKMSEAQILRLLPVLQEKTVNVDKLSSQIQLANDTQAVNLKADFKSNKSGGFDVVIKVAELKENYNIVAVNNTGNDYSGDWRLNYTYVDTNLTKQADTLGIATVTSPGNWDQVKQAAVVYRQILPKSGDSFYFSYSYSDVDLGQIANFGALSMNATGKGQAYGLHYQKNITYMADKKEFVDFGFDYKKYQDAQDYTLSGASILTAGTDFNVKTFGVNYVNSKRGVRNAVAYNIGYVTNMNGNQAEYNAYRYGSDTHFNIFKAGVNQQYKFKSDWIASLRVNAQYTKNNLLSTEQLGAGGTDTVRGFDEREISADNGYIANVEFYTPEIAKGQRFVLFTDMAHLFNNRTNVGELKNDTIASVGIGYRYSNPKSGWSAALDYGHIIDDIENKADQGSGKLHLAVTKIF